jgi:hypothetical protein
MLEDFIKQANYAAAQARLAAQHAQQAGADSAGVKAQLQQYLQEMASLRNALARVQVQNQVGDPNIQRVENIPGRRVPFDFVVDIPLAAGTNSTQTQTITVDQSGPFVCVARYATFLSTYQFQVASESGNATFQGRSYGRYRPIHSQGDVNDGQPFSSVVLAQAFPGTGAPHISSPSNASPWRSMEMDFRIAVREQGTSLPRQNVPIPSALWVKAGSGDPMQLGVLDFFERGQVIQFDVQPLHPANPAYGNISGFTGPGNDFPFADSGWDAVEGISDPTADVDGTDPVTRSASGVLTIGFLGYRIWQPAGAGQL